MKKLLVFCGLICSLLVSAQGLGDYMEIDGVPGFVFYVDETGEHGLVMSFYELSEKQTKKFVKKGLLTEEKASKLCPSYNPKNEKLSAKEKKVYRNDLVTLLGDEGEQNALIIAEYCQEKNLSLDLLPGQGFAAQLGEGWFIPGDKELTLFAEFYAGGLGKEHSLGNTSITNRPKELSNDPIVQEAIMQIAFFGLRSSTIKDADYGFRGLISYVSTGAFSKIKRWLEIVDKVKATKFTYMSVENASRIRTCAVHKF